MTVRRHDAIRQADRLIATTGAADRRDFATDGILVALTDPAYRAYLSALLQNDSTPLAKRERASLGRRFADWDQRIFGATLSEETVADAISRPLIGRR